MVVNLYKEMGNTHFVHKGLNIHLYNILQKAINDKDAVDISGMRFAPDCAHTLATMCSNGLTVQGASHSMQEHIDENRRRASIEIDPSWPIITLPDKKEDITTSIKGLAPKGNYRVDESKLANTVYICYIGLVLCVRHDINLYIGALANPLVRTLSRVFRQYDDPNNEYFCVRDSSVLVKKVVNGKANMDQYGEVDLDAFKRRFYALPKTIGSSKFPKEWREGFDELMRTVVESYYTTKRLTLYEYLDKGDQ